MAGWFGPKRYGYGIGPRGWQGWLATALAIGAILLDTRFFRPQQFGLPIWTRPASALLLGLGFLAVIWLKYEPDD
jgi:hypothetical protein